MPYKGKQLVVGGMDFDSYDANRDPSGEIGHRLAEAEFQRRGGFSTSRSPAGYDISQVARLALTCFPALEAGECRSAQDYKKRLDQLRKAGYPVQPYSYLTRDKVAIYYHAVAGAIRVLAQRHCPGVLEEIARVNAAHDAEDELLR